MQIPIGPLPPASLTLNTAKPLVQVWSVGQLLEATVATPVDQGRLSVVIGGTRLEASTNTPLRPGQNLLVRVERQAETIVLRVLEQRPGPQEVQASALRAALPRQAPLPPLFANLDVLAKTPDRIRHDAAPQWGQLARSVVGALPQARALSTPEGLRRAMADSGVFFESRAAGAGSGSTPFPVQDLKAGLLRLLALVTGERVVNASPVEARPAPPLPATASSPSASSKNTPATAFNPPASSQNTAATPQPSAVAPPPQAEPPQRTSPPQPQTPSTPSLPDMVTPEKIATAFRSQLEGAVSRIQLHQLNSLPTEEGVRPVWSMEIPVRTEERVDIWSLCIEQEAPGKGSSAVGRWSVSLAFELETLGPVRARVALQDQKVSASFWAEHEETAELFDQLKGQLRERLVELGLTVGNILCAQGLPPTPEKSPSPSRAVNIEA